MNLLRKLMYIIILGIAFLFMAGCKLSANTSASASAGQYQYTMGGRNISRYDLPTNNSIPVHVTDFINSYGKFCTAVYTPSKQSMAISCT